MRGDIRRVAMTGSGEVEADEVDHLRSEVAELRSRLEAGRDERSRRRRVRGVLALVLVVLATLAVPVATTAVWARRTVVNETAFAEVVGTLPEEPAVQVALTDYLTAQVTAAIDVEDLFREALPRGGRVLAPPLASAVEGFVRDKVAQVVGSERFAALWDAAARRAQQAALALLRGGQGNLRTEDGEVILNLVPALNAVLAAINETSPQVLGRDVTLPEVTAAELPEEARQRVEAALGRPLPEDFGSLVVFRSDELAAVQDAAQAVQRGLLVLLVVALVCVVGALAVSGSRRRTLLQLAIGIAFGVVLVRRLGLRVQEEVLDLAAVPTNRAAVEVVTDRLLSGLLTLTGGVLVVCVGVAALALLTGPSRWAARLRDGAAAVGRRAFGIAGGPEGAAVDGWLERHLPLVQAGVLVVATAALLLVDLSWWGIALVVVVTAAVLSRLSRITPVPDPGSQITRAG